MEVKNVTWEDIKKANDLIQTKNIKGKEYAEVKERVIAYRRVYPNGQIVSSIEYTDNFVVCNVEAFDENGRLLATGHAREYLKNSYCLEVAETSAIGRCLGFIGFGINTSIASAEDMDSVEDNKIFDELTPQDVDKLIKEFYDVFGGKEQADILNGLHVKDLKTLNPELLKLLVEHGKK